MDQVQGILMQNQNLEPRHLIQRLLAALNFTLLHEMPKHNLRMNRLVQEILGGVLLNTILPANIA
jgi:hypothetical protein